MATRPDAGTVVPLKSTLVCLGSSGSGYPSPVEPVRTCAVCGVVFEDVSQIPVHFVREAEGFNWDEIVKEWHG